MHGKNSSTPIDVLSISKHGIWLLVHEQEFFLPFEHYSWFKDATISQIYDFQLYHDNHLHWPSLDIDISIDSLKNPDAYPLKYKT